MENSTQQDAKLHIVVTCMGRREMVEKSIETMITQPNTTYTLVDYSCPQQTGQWVAEHYPQAKVVFVEGRKHWHASEARNIGAASVKDGWLCLIDSDNLLHPEFSQMVLSTITPDTYITCHETQTQLAGLLACAKEAYDRAGGYDEIMRDWGWEDIEIRLSMGRVGLKRVQLPIWLVSHIDHSEALRTVNCDVKDKVYSHCINGFYSVAKNNLRTCGMEISNAELATFYRYLKERFFAGNPWLSWPENEVPPSDFNRLIAHIFSVGEGYRGISTETWGGVRLFRIERESDTIVELLSAYNRHQVTLRAPGRDAIEVTSIRGEKSELPLVDGEAVVTINAEPIFLPACVELVKDVALEITPSPASTITVVLTPAPDLASPAHVRVTCGEDVLYDETLQLTASKSLSLPVSVADPDKNRPATVTVTVGGRTQIVTRRSTFVVVPRVTEEEILSCTPPADLFKIAIGGEEMWRGKPGSYTGWDDLHGEVVWGWTDDALICWIARWDDHPMEGSDEGHKVNLAVDGNNTRAHLHEGLACRLRWRDDECSCWVEWQPRPTDEPAKRFDILKREVDGNCARMVIRIPFEGMDVTPRAGMDLGAAMLLSDNHGEGMKGWLEWGGGIRPTKSARYYNDITLTDGPRN